MLIDHTDREEDAPVSVFVPHYELTADSLPGPDARWREMLEFAVSFDGYVVFPSIAVTQDFMVESREAFARDRSLPEGLTMLRTALFVEERNDQKAGSDGDGPDMEYIRALVEGIRSLVAAGAHKTPAPDTVGGIRDKVMNAYDRLLVGYSKWGGHLHHGWLGYGHAQTYVGPAVWSERDCSLRFCLELAKEWPDAVHQEFPVAKWTRDDLPDGKKPEYVDVAVLELADFPDGDDVGERFRQRTHEAFFELKWCTKGWSDRAREHTKRLISIPYDIEKLASNIGHGRCHVAGMMVFDDGGWWATKQPGVYDRWPRDVWNLYVGPYALKRRGLI